MNVDSVEFERYFTALHNLARGMVRQRLLGTRRQDTEDIVQEACLVLWQRREWDEDMQPPETMMRRVLSGICKNLIQQSNEGRRGTRPLTVTEGVESVEGTEVDPSERAETEERSKAICDALEKFPAQYREIVL